MTELSLAPMMKITTPQFRRLVRRISSHVVLFTEMIVSSTVIHASQDKLIEMLGVADNSTVVQIGGSNPDEIAMSVKRLKDMGWVYFNLNCGCPSERVKYGRFGASLMLYPEIIIEIINQTYKETGVVLSLKIRTGVDENDNYEFLYQFAKLISEKTKCWQFYIHARKCWLKGLSPKQNRNVPPLNYDAVYRLKEDMPHLFISLNGGIKENGLEKVKNLDGLMIGRHAYENITIFNEMINEKRSIADDIISYIKDEINMGTTNTRLLSPLINLRKGKKQNKEFRRIIGELIKDKSLNNTIELKIKEIISDL